MSSKPQSAPKPSVTLKRTATIKVVVTETDAINQLELNSLFTQGTVDGFVSVSEGDNLYEKLGGMEILVQDGVVQKITPVAKFDAE
ncbi:hypothetical protein EBR96_02025 [bacterium]|nr:hypothetical protein [bacterium]